MGIKLVQAGAIPFQDHYFSDKRHCAYQGN